MVWSIFEYVATFIEYAIYSDFMVRFLKPKKKENTILCYLLIFSINTVITLIFNYFMNYEGILCTFRIAANIIISLILLNGTLFEKLFASLSLDIAALMSSFLALETLGILSGGTVEEMIEVKGFIRLIIIFIAKALLFAATRMLLKLKGDKKYSFSVNEWITIGIIFIITMLIGLSIFRIDLNAGISTDTPMSIGVGTGLIFINILVYILMKRISEKNIENTNLLMDKMQNELYHTQFEEYEKQYIEMTKIRHDMKNHLQCIATFISEEEYSNANKYIEEIIENKLNFGCKQINTCNKAVDIIANMKLMQCKKENILTVVNAGKFETAIDDTDMCSLLGNVLDNAIEACLSLDTERELHFEITQKKEYINIIVKNSISESVLQRNPELKTTKSQKEIHRYGVKSIKDIVKKYNGMIEFFEKNGFFIADIWLPCKDFE